MTKENTYEFVHDYEEFFSIEEYDGIEYIELQIEDLRRQFRMNITVDLAKALARRESLKALNINATA